MYGNEIFTTDKINNKPMITTVEIAEMMEVEHWRILRKLEGYEKDGKHMPGHIEMLGNNKIVVTDYFIKSTYLTGQNKEMPCYKVTRLGCDYLANKFTGEKGVVFTAKYVKRFYEMEQEQKPKVPQSYKEALLETLRLLEENEKMQEQITQQKEEITQQKVEISHKEDVIIGLVDDIDLATKRQRITQIVRHGADGNYRERYNLLYSEFERKYHCDLKRRMDKFNVVERFEHEPPEAKAKNTMDYIERGMKKIPQLYEIACKLFENDVEKLKAEWDSIIS